MTYPKCRAPAYRFCVGDRNEFAIEAILPALKHAQISGPSSVLSLTDGYFTFVVGGLNVFRVNSDSTLPEALQNYSNINLSMVLEWVYFDKAYALTDGVKSFAEIASGADSPDLRFQLAGHDVQLEWDLKDQKRAGSHFSNLEGRGSVSYLTYLMCLALTADSIITATEWRASCVERLSEWHQWLSAYKAEQEAFQEFVQTWIRKRGKGWEKNARVLFAENVASDAASLPTPTRRRSCCARRGVVQLTRSSAGCSIGSRRGSQPGRPRPPRTGLWTRRAGCRVLLQLGRRRVG